MRRESLLGRLHHLDRVLVPARHLDGSMTASGRSSGKVRALAVAFDVDFRVENVEDARK